VRELVLAELETGEKSRQYLNTVAEDKLGASSDTPSTSQGSHRYAKTA
jgi:hypothetical protein